MKMIMASVLGLLFAGSAFATSPNRFLAKACAPVESENSGEILAISHICYGHFATSGLPAIKLELNDGEVRFYTIEFARPLGKKMGRNVSHFEGALFDPEREEFISGMLAYTTGMTTSWDINLKTEGGLRYQGPLYDAPFNR